MATLHYDTFKDGPARKKAGYALMYFQSKYVSVLSQSSQSHLPDHSSSQQSF